MTVYLENIVYVLLGFMQLIMVVTWLLSYHSNKYINVYLIIIFTQGALNALYSGLLSDEANDYIVDNYIWLRPVILITIPSIYLYFKSFINDTKQVDVKDFIHFIYPVFWSFLFFLQHHYEFFQEDTFQAVLKVNVGSYIVIYFVLTTLFLKNFYQKRNQDLKSEQQYNLIKNWVAFFYILCLLAYTRAFVHFSFDLAYKDGLPAVVSLLSKTILIFLIFFKVFTTPEILFGNKKLKKVLSGHPKNRIMADTKIVKINNEYYLNNKRIEDYFEGKTRECIRMFLDKSNEFVNLNQLNDVFENDEKMSYAALKNRREQCIKEIKLLLAFRLDVSLDTVFIETHDPVDKRIKWFRLNPELIVTQNSVSMPDAS